MIQGQVPQANQGLLRFIWCQTYKGTDFSKYIFLDETLIRLWDLPLYHCRLPRSYPRAMPCTSKYRKKVNICGGISFKGPTPFMVILVFTYKKYYLYFNLIKSV